MFLASDCRHRTPFGGCTPWGPEVPFAPERKSTTLYRGCRGDDCCNYSFLGLSIGSDGQLFVVHFPIGGMHQPLTIDRTSKRALPPTAVKSLIIVALRRPSLTHSPSAVALFHTVSPPTRSLALSPTRPLAHLSMRRGILCLHPKTTMFPFGSCIACRSRPDPFKSAVGGRRRILLKYMRQNPPSRMLPAARCSFAYLRICAFAHLPTTHNPQPIP